MIHLVVTIRHIPDSDDLYGDIILVTENEKQARTVCQVVKNRGDYPGLNYNKLTAFDDCICFERKIGEVLQNNQD